jgi:hypothetical protein
MGHCHKSIKGTFKLPTRKTYAKALRAFSSAQSNRIFTKNLAITNQTPPHQPLQIAIGGKFFYSSSPKWSSDCSSTNQILSILYYFLSSHFLWRRSFSTSRQLRSRPRSPRWTWNHDRPEEPRPNRA